MIVCATHASKVEASSFNLFPFVNSSHMKTKTGAPVLKLTYCSYLCIIHLHIFHLTHVSLALKPSFLMCSGVVDREHYGAFISISPSDYSCLTMNFVSGRFIGGDRGAIAPPSISRNPKD